MTLVQKWPFFHIFFQAIQARKMSFSIFYIKKTPLKPIKTKSSNSRKTDLFQEVLTHSFGPKLGGGGNIGQENVFYDILEQKKPFQAIKTRISKGRQIDIFPKGLTHGCGPKMALVPTFFFKAIQARKMSFTIFYIEKTHLQPTKKKFKKTKTDIFPKVLTYGQFWSKNGRFSNFYFLFKIGQENVFYDLVHQKKRLCSL